MLPDRIEPDRDPDSDMIKLSERKMTAISSIMNNDEVPL